MVSHVAWKTKMRSVMIPRLGCVFSCLTFLTLAKPTCVPNNVYKALTDASYEGEIFCSQYLRKTSYIGTLEDVITLPTYVTVTDSSSTDPVSVFLVSSSTTTAISTSYASQTTRIANPTAFTRPLPSYVQKIAPSRVSSACSCIINSIYTDTFYGRCEGFTTNTMWTTITWVTGQPGTSTVTYELTETTVVEAMTTAPFPTACPQADNVDYVGSDRSIWGRGCDSYLSASRFLTITTAKDFQNCIEACISYNKKAKWNQCQAAVFRPQLGDNCELVSDPGFIVGGAEGNVATLRFFEPSQTTPEYCATVSGAIRGL